MFLRVIECAVCGRQEKEKEYGAGWPGWGGLVGVEIDGVPNPSLCPKDLAPLTDFADKLVQKRKGGSVGRRHVVLGAPAYRTPRG